jgi:zinc protease
MAIDPSLKSHQVLASLKLCLLAVLCVAAWPAPAMPPIQHWETANGARVYYVPAPELPMVDIRIIFDAGGARDGKAPGLAALTNALLDQGAAGADANRVAERFEDVGAQLNTGSLRDMAWLGLRTLTDRPLMAQAVTAFTDVLTRPDFRSGDLQRERQRMLVALQLQQQKPDAVAEKAFYRALYGNHPYGSPPEGTTESVSSLSREDILAFYQQYYVARNAVIGIVGAVAREEAEKLAEGILKSLPPGKAPEPLPPVPDLNAANEVVVPFPSTQTHVLMGRPGVARGDPDYFSLYVGNYIFGGGGLVSLLSNEIREDRGLSYSVYSQFVPMARKGPFELGLQTRNDQVEEAISVARETLVRYLDEGPSEKELDAAKKHITGGYALRIDSNGKILEYLGAIGFYHLPLDYLETFNARIEAVTREDVKAAFRRRILPDQLVTVVVGGESG